MAHFRTTTIIKIRSSTKSALVTLILPMLLLTCCQPQNSTIPYKVGQSYLFKVTVTDSSTTVLQIDTLTMTIKNKGLIGVILGLNMADWKSSKFSDDDQKRGINLESDLVEIQVPTQYDYLENENIVIAGYPSYSTSMLKGYTSESDHLFAKGYGKLTNKKLKEYKSISDSLMVKFQNDSIACQVADYWNLTGIEEYGLYKLKTFYSSQYGFLKMYYEYPNGKKIVFELIEIQNKP